QRFESRPALLQRQRADIRAILLQQIVREESHGHALENRRAELLAADALLQIRERPNRAVAPCDELAIEHNAIRQRGRRAHHFGEALGHDVLTARPNETLPIATNELPANTIPLPLDLPTRPLAQCRDVTLQR